MRFRKSIKLGGSARINLSKSGIGASIGTRGARYSVHSSGRRTTTLGIPGSGLSYTKSSKTKSRATSSTISSQQKVLNRHAKKVELATLRRNKASEKLKDKYALGKVTKAQYNKLLERDNDISIDLMIFGRGAGVKLAERYILGKIDKDEFENLKNEIIGEPEVEKDNIIASFNGIIDNTKLFASNAKLNMSESNCGNCGKKKGFFSPLHNVSDIILCGPCKNQYNSLRTYSGHDGEFYKSQSAIVEPEGENSLVLTIQPQYILDYR